jgi:hypothetical protein
MYMPACDRWCQARALFHPGCVELRYKAEGVKGQPCYGTLLILLYHELATRVHDSTRIWLYCIPTSVSHVFLSYLGLVGCSYVTLGLVGCSYVTLGLVGCSYVTLGLLAAPM